MPLHTPRDDFPPWIHAGIAMSRWSWGFVADFSASLMIIGKYVEISSLKHQDEGGSLPTGQAQMFVSSHSWLQQQGCARHSQVPSLSHDRSWVLQGLQPSPSISSAGG